MSEAASYVSAEYLRKVAGQMRAIKERTHDLLRLAPGHSVLDVGCGPGTDTVALARRVGTGGRVVGLDIDEAMLADAENAAQEAEVSDWIEHVCGDVRKLPFADDVFDACRAERLLQVLAGCDPEQVTAEMARVLRPGGRLLLADTDWYSASVDFSDLELERRLMGFFATTMRPNGAAGRQLSRLLKLAGCTAIELEVFAHTMLDFSETPFGDWLRREAVGAAVATEPEMDRWQSELQTRTQEGTFFGQVAYVVAVGVLGGQGP